MDMEGGGGARSSHRIARCLSYTTLCREMRNCVLRMARVVCTQGASPGPAVWAEQACRETQTTDITLR
ncbi:uncharacterized protein BDZ83DRAFT_597149 [Colletotrichum acutatum]|uniref:Uncharacterized protein n=1 Tax=Glomerella acutata TaxID=27357 RepID=A0AAD8XQJ6_GLOAC|nr:uncharacterized protein BDZ83DRAFT_597149 [Colletotrichum acutatum]KAK1731897.1 hypothetical protein BDZ83DRAFT_597149 [Colletotrichum acutatum]